jgi:hypothetical protein
MTVPVWDELEQWEQDAILRAQAWRRQQDARDAFKQTSERALRGDPQRLTALREATSGLLPWAGWDATKRVVGDESGEEWTAEA